MSEPTIFISAGEASGELYGAMLVEELRSQLAAEGRHATLRRHGWSAHGQGRTSSGRAI